MDNQINKERSSETALKKKSRIAPVLIGVVCAVLIVIVVTVIFYSNAPSRQLEKQMKLADKYLLDLDYENAILAYKEAIAINPKNEEAYVKLTDLYKLLASQAEKEGDLNKAANYYELVKGVAEEGLKNVESDVLRKTINELESPQMVAKGKEVTEEEGEIENLSYETSDPRNWWVFGGDNSVEQYYETDTGFLRIRYWLDENGNITKSDRAEFDERGVCVADESFDANGNTVSKGKHIVDDNGQTKEILYSNPDGSLHERHVLEWKDSWNQHDPTAWPIKKEYVYDAEGNLISDDVIWYHYIYLGSLDNPDPSDEGYVRLADALNK